MSHSASELKELYDEAMKKLFKLHRKETMKAVLALNSGQSSNFVIKDLKVDSFVEEHGEAIREMDSDECVAFIKILSSVED